MSTTEHTSTTTVNNPGMATAHPVAVAPSTTGTGISYSNPALDASETTHRMEENAEVHSHQTLSQTHLIHYILNY